MELKFKSKPDNHPFIPLEIPAHLFEDFQFVLCAWILHLDDFLEKEGAEKARKAFKLLLKFSDQAIEKGYIKLV